MAPTLAGPNVAGDCFPGASGCIVLPMSGSLSLHIAAFLALLPAAFTPLRQTPGRDGLFWGTLGVAIVGALVVSIVPSLRQGMWSTSFSSALWVSIAATLLLFSELSFRHQAAWRLTPVLMPYLIALGAMATIWEGAEGAPLADHAPAFWTVLHIIIAVLTYGMLTLGAVAALAGFLQERALKARRPTSLTRRLPAAAEADRLSWILLYTSEWVLGAGLLTGMAVEYLETGAILQPDHKSMLSSLAFLVIGGLILARSRWGVRGRVGARVLLLAYLLLTLAFPGVKFVSDVLL
ncbi:hypothetical protein CKO38_06945 [Rhodospirillum rubrum]|nr:hypothetical protein [Rhodospirillum rubrum]MBK1676413.1 hypothetical protein [Rhodospirillum rubrum]